MINSTPTGSFLITGSKAGRRMAETRNRIMFWIFAVLSLAADQWSKYDIFHRLSEPSTHHVLSLFHVEGKGGFQLRAQFQYDHVTGQMVKDQYGNPIPYVNQGALFGFLGNHQSLANGLFALISCAAAIAIIFWSTQKGSTGDFPLTLALSFWVAPWATFMTGWFSTACVTFYTGIFISTGRFSTLRIAGLWVGLFFFFSWLFEDQRQIPRRQHPLPQHHNPSHPYNRTFPYTFPASSN
jgi:lipoprotein signal peptidase